MEFAPPPLEMSMLSICGKYHSKKLELKRELNRTPTIDEVAAAMDISVEKADRCENLINEIMLDEKHGNLEQAAQHVNFLNNGGKSRRHGRKSRRHGKKSRRHAKKSRRHAKKSRR